MYGYIHSVFANSDHKGRTPVHFAAQSGHSGLLITLLRAGGSPTCPDKTGYTPLHWASYNGNLIDMFKAAQYNSLKQNISP